MQINKNIIVIGSIDGDGILLLINKADIDNSCAKCISVYGFEITKFDSIQTPITFNTFNQVDEEKSKNFIAILNTKLTENDIASINSFLKTYKELIIQTINTLIECDNQIFTEGLNILMNNELKEIDEVFEEGDIYEFNINHLENSADTNVQLILKTIKKIRQSINSLQNLNLIKDEEIEWK